MKSINNEDMSFYKIKKNYIQTVDENIQDIKQVLDLLEEQHKIIEEWDAKEKVFNKVSFLLLVVGFMSALYMSCKFDFDEVKLTFILFVLWVISVIYMSFQKGKTVSCFKDKVNNIITPEHYINFKFTDYDYENLERIEFYRNILKMLNIVKDEYGSGKVYFVDTPLIPHIELPDGMKLNTQVLFESDNKYFQVAIGGGSYMILYAKENPVSLGEVKVKQII